MPYIHDVDYSRLWAIDIEGDPIPSTKVYLCCCINAESGERVALRTYREMIDWFRARTAEGCQFVAHNGIGYDFPTLNRVVGTEISIGRVIDTNIMSQVYHPGMKVPQQMFKLPPDSRSGPHSLKAWGFRVSLEKIDFDDFTSGWSEEMEKYCFRDTEICLRVYKRLSARMREKGFTDTGIEIEHRAWAWIQKQRKDGFYFNLPEAHHLYNKLREMEKNIEGQINKFWPPELCVVQNCAQARKKDGSYTKNFVGHMEKFVKVVELPNGRYDCYDYVYFDVGSPNQRRDKLLELGWEPKEFTETGLAKPTHKGQLVPSLVEFIERTGNEQVRLVGKWMEINYLANMINTWIMACDEKDQCIHGSLYLAQTLRYRHSAPNTANIPGVRLAKDANGDEHPLYGEEGAFTYEARDLWTCRPGDRVLIGVDAKGIQLRNLAHHLGNADFIDSVLSKDPHTANMEKFKLPSRPITKTITYAIIMGAGDGRIASEAKMSLKEAKKNKQIFFEKIPEFPRLINRLKAQQQKSGRIILCSGTPLLVPEDRLVIPYLLQGDESQIMKKAMDLTFREVARRGLDVIKVGDIHDEWQNDCLAEHAEEFIEICHWAFKTAGEFFDYRLPIACDAKIGKTWAQTH